MPIIIREFRCGDCGTTFESTDPVEEVVCPACTAQEAERVFLTPPAIRSQNTSRADTIVRELAADYGLSDVSNKDGAPVKKAPSQGPAAPTFATGDAQAMQVLSKLGNQGDGFSGVLPALRQAGGPRTWAKTPYKR